MDYFIECRSNTQTLKNIEASMNALKRPTLKDQLDSQQLIIFRNGVT